MFRWHEDLWSPHVCFSSQGFFVFAFICTDLLFNGGLASRDLGRVVGRAGRGPRYKGGREGCGRRVVRGWRGELRGQRAKGGVGGGSGRGRGQLGVHWSPEKHFLTWYRWGGLWAKGGVGGWVGVGRVRARAGGGVAEAVGVDVGSWVVAGGVGGGGRRGAL